MTNATSEEIKFPIELITGQVWSITKWYFRTGQMVKPRDIICTIESKKQIIEFESYLSGVLVYTFPQGQKITKESILAEIRVKD